MGKKDKKKGDKDKTETRERRSQELRQTEDHQDQSLRTNAQEPVQQSFRTIISEDLQCVRCNISTGEPDWFVQCDDCDRYFHFSCVGLESIKEEDPWSCYDCKVRSRDPPNANSTAMVLRTNQERENDQVSSQSSVIEEADGASKEAQIKVTAEVHRESYATIKDVEDQENIYVTKSRDTLKNETRPSVRALHRVSNPFETWLRHGYRVTNNDMVEETTKSTMASSGRKIDSHKESEISPKHLTNQIFDTVKSPVTTRNEELSSKEVQKSQLVGENMQKSPTKVSSTLSSQSQRQIDLQYAEAELKLQARLDDYKLATTLDAKRLAAEIIAESERKRRLAEIAIEEDLKKAKLAAELDVKLEEMKLIENREKKFLEEKYKIGSRSGSMVSRSSKATKNTSYVSTWIEDHRNEFNQFKEPTQVNFQNQKEKDSSINVTIPLDKGEREKLRKHNQEPWVQNPTQLKNGPTYTWPKNLHPGENQKDPTKEKKKTTVNPSESRTYPVHELFQKHMASKQEKTEVKQQPQRNSDAWKNLEENIYTQKSKREPEEQSKDKQNEISYEEWINQEVLKFREYQKKSNRQKAKFTEDRDSKLYRQSEDRQPQFSEDQDSRLHQQSKNRQSQSSEGRGRNERQEQAYLRSEMLYESDDHFENPPQLSKRSQADSVSLWATTRVLTREHIAARQITDKKLPSFKGDPKDWNVWFKTLCTTTKTCGFNNSENIGRIEKSLDGKAREIVINRLTESESVPWIVETLEMCFGQPKVILKSLVNKIKTYPTLKENDLESLRDFSLQVQGVVDAMESMDLHDHLDNPGLLDEIVDKLPSQTKMNWAMHIVGKPKVNLKTLSVWLYEIAKLLSKIITTSTTNFSNNSDGKRFERKGEGKSTRMNVHVEGDLSNWNKAQQEKSPKKTFPCRVCNKGCDKVENCPRFKSYSVSDRYKAVAEHSLCRRCLRFHKGSCYSTSVCGKDECKQQHHPLLHSDTKRKEQNRQESNKSKSKEKYTSENSTLERNNVHYDASKGTMLKIIPVLIHHNGKSVSTFAFYDDGSTATMMEKHISDKLGLSGEPEQICLLWTKNIHRTEKAERVTIEISGTREKDRRYELKGIRTVQSLHLPAQSINKAELAKKYPYLAKIPFEDYENAVPGILIGSDKPKLSTQQKTIEGDDDSPIASKTRLGWSVHGPRNSDDEVELMNYHNFEICKQHNQFDSKIHQQIKEYFSIENFGIQASEKLNLKSKDDQRALDLLEKFTKKVDGRYETGLLWKEDMTNLPDSYPMAMRRLISLEKQGENMVKAIEDKIADYVAKKYARKLTEKELKSDQPAWYLPVFGVIHPKKPEKLRMVFDGAAKVKKTSLNSTLLKGPDKFTSLVDILRRFREKSIAITGDIKEMYHQVRIRKEDQHFQRFLSRNGESNRAPDVYVMEVMTFGATCSPCAAQYIKNLNAETFRATYPQAVEAIVENHYVDDMMDGADTIEAAIKLAKDVKMIHAHGGFEIRNFLSNSKQVLQAIGESGSRDVKYITPNLEAELERVLGMWWNMSSDVFTFSLKYTLINEDILHGKRLPTKRELLRTLMSIFDPMGLLSNYLIHLKILIQEIWRAELEWDDKIRGNELINRWSQWLEILPGVEKVEVPRLYSSKMSPGTPTSVQLHVFVDASEDAFASVIYLRVEDENGVDCALVGSKAKVAPLKYLSIPRKELLAAVLGTRLSTSVSKSQRFKIDRRVIWSDSETVLSWLNSNHRKYSQFVAHRVGEILESTDVVEWRWIPTKENVADEATKWSKIPTFDSSNRWFSGPEFLKFSEDTWPQKRKIKTNVQEEMKAHFRHSSFVIPKIINPERFSNWNRMVRAVAYAIRFRHLFNKKFESGQPLTQEELKKAENLIFRQAQFEGYPSEMVILARNNTLPIDKQVFIEKPSPLFDGTPYLDAEGVLRMKTRTDGARDLSMDTKRPIILPKDSRITKLLMLKYHAKYFHQNHETVVNEIRQKFYIPHLRVVQKKTRKDCQMCKVKRPHTMEPQMADLPRSRLAFGFRPFSFVGVDYFGPMKVAIGRRTEKRWGVLFTCLTIRAIHIELVPSIDTNSCILCVRNFVNERGSVIEFHSDCGTNFTGLDNELQEEIKKIDQDRLKVEFTSTYTKWLFNPPAAPHMGGSWERLIRSVKSAMNEAMPTRTPKEEMLRSLLKEVQNVVNSRPLTFIPLETEEDEALTPNHFLLGSSNGSKPPCKIDLDGPYLRASWKEAQRLTELFWQRFVKEYLPTLTRRTKWFKKEKPLQQNDLVLVIDAKNPRNSYPKARILETRIGSNGQVRRAKLELISEAKMDSNQKICLVRKFELWRPAHKLALLDVLPKQDGLADPGTDSKTSGRMLKNVHSNDRGPKAKACTKSQVGSKRTNVKRNGK